MSHYKRPPRVGTRVTFCPGPGSRLLYSGSMPPSGRAGTVTTMPGFGRRNFMPGPGGGLLYVDWDDFGTLGVSLYDVYPERRAPCSED